MIVGGRAYFVFFLTYGRSPFVCFPLLRGNMAVNINMYSYTLILKAEHNMYINIFVYIYECYGCFIYSNDNTYVINVTTRWRQPATKTNFSPAWWNLQSFVGLSEPITGVHHQHQPLHDKINPKDCQVQNPQRWFRVSPIFLGLCQVITANPDNPYKWPMFLGSSHTSSVSVFGCLGIYKVVPKRSLEMEF